MQKFTSVLIACLILVSSTGFAFNVHYCGDQIASVSIGTQPEEDCLEPVAEKACCVEAAKDHKSCCSDTVVDAQDQPDVILKSFEISFEAPMVPPIVSVAEFGAPEFPVLDKQRNYRYLPHAPPLFKLYKQLIFYA